MKYYLKERDNFQAPNYYVKLGKIPAKEAKWCLKPVHGHNYIHSFDTKEEYEAKIESLKAEGVVVLD